MWEPLVESALLPPLQHAFDRSLSPVGTQFSYWQTPMTDSNTSESPPASHKVCKRDRGPCPQRPRMKPRHCWRCLRSFTGHLCITRSCVQSKTRHSTGETEVTDATVPVLAGRGDAAPFKATSKPSSFFRGPAELGRPVRALRQHHIHVGVISFISFISGQKPEWSLRWMALSPAWPSRCCSAGLPLL